MANVTTGDADEVLLGAGVLYVAPIGTAEPTTASAALPSAFREVGWTDQGSAIDIAYTNEGIPVAEEFYPVKYVTTGVEISVGFAMKQMTRANLALALNLGANAASDASALEPPSPGEEVRVMLVLDTEEGARWLFRRAIQGGSVNIARQKAPNVALLPVQFRVEHPGGQDAPFTVFPNADGVI